MKYPISVQTFEKIINDKYIYVDKTDLVYDLAQQNVCFLSRPRRFGKSLLISTLDAYFSGKKELFEGLKIYSLEKNWETYPIFRIDFAVGDYTNENELEVILDNYLDEWENHLGLSKKIDSLGLRFKTVLQSAEEKTGHKAVVLIDEYDKPLLDVLGTSIEEKNRNILKGFYGTFKAADANLRFVFLTGVTKFSQVSIFSGFNQPNDISMDSKFDAICGITEEELYKYFAAPIAEMADSFGCSVAQMKDLLKKQYDGYHFSKGMTDIYNPFSIINAFNKMDLDSFWYRSGTPAYLVKLLEGHNINMQALTGMPYESQYFLDYRADAEDPLAMLYQSGYLTIKGYDSEYREYMLDYPNDEVRNGFAMLTSQDRC